MLEFLKKVILGGLVFAVIYGLGIFINYLGRISYRSILRMIITLPILVVVTIIFSSLYIIEPNPFIMSVSADSEGKIDELSINKNAAEVKFKVDHIEGNKLYLKDRSGRVYLSIIPNDLREGNMSTNIIPTNNFLYGWFYVILKINENMYLHFRFMNSMAALLTIGAVLGVYFYGAIEGKKAYLTFRK